MSQIDYQVILDQVEQLTRSGSIGEVKLIFHKLIPKQIPRNYCAPIAELATRNSMYLYAMRCLQSYIRPQLLSQELPTDRERLAYAKALIGLQMLKEARELLSEIEVSEVPEALLSMAFCYFGEWNYVKARPYIQKFIKHPKVTDYRRIVGRVNLAAVFVFTNDTINAEIELAQLDILTQNHNARMLRGNVFELYGQLHIHQRDYKTAIKYLKVAEDLIGDSNSIYNFFIRKWKLVSELMLDKGDDLKLKKVNDLRQEAIYKWSHWETYRELDLYEAVATNNRSLLQKVYLGTPHLEYIRKMEGVSENIVFDSGAFALDLPHFMSKAPHEIKVFVNDVYEGLRGSRYQQKIWRILFQDFYKPPTLGELFSKLYPNEYFDPEHSPRRILNQFYGLAQHLNKKYPGCFKLFRKRNEFFYSVSPGTQLYLKHISRKKIIASSEKQKIQAMGARPFAANQLAAHLGFSLRSAQLLLAKFVADGFLLKLGKGRSTKYIQKCYARQHSRSKKAA